MRRIGVWLLIAILEAVAIFVPVNAYAQGAGLGAINHIIQGGSYVSGTASAVAQEAIRVASGRVVPITVTAAAAVASSRMAGVAAGIMKAGTGIGLATLILPWIWDQSGYVVCPPPAFICKPDPSVKDVPLDSDYLAGSQVFTNIGAAAQAAAQAICTSNGQTVGYYCPVPTSDCSVTPTSWSCKTVQPGAYTTVGGGRTIKQPATCPSGTHLDGQVCKPDVVPKIPATEPDIAGQLGPKLDSDPGKSKQLYDTLRQNYPSVPIILPSDPVTVTAPQVTTAPQVKTETIANPDGTTSTKTSSTVDTITPQQVGTTISNTTMSYPTTSTTTITIVNNSTNVTNTTTEVINQPSPEVVTPPEPKENDLCKLHPELNVCRNSTVDGTCEAVTCSGDAIQCATLQAAAKMECRAKKDADEIAQSSLKTLGQGAVGGTVDSTLPTPQNGDTVNMGSLDASGWLGGGACFTDKSFTVQGHTVSIPFSRACDYLVALRYALMVAAMIVSFKILSGAILRD
jgi:hypothetical protein